MNNVALIGRLTKEAAITTIKTKDGNLLKAVFTLAVDRNADEADFIRCQAYGKTAEIVERYTAKGTRIGVTGHIKTDSYEHKDGYTVYTSDVIVDRFDFADAAPVKEEEPAANERGRSRARR